MFPVLVEILLPRLGTLTRNLLVKLLDRITLHDSDSPWGENRIITGESVEEFQDESAGTDGLCEAGGEIICCCCAGP